MGVKLIEIERSKTLRPDEKDGVVEVKGELLALLTVVK